MVAKCGNMVLAHTGGIPGSRCGIVPVASGSGGGGTAAFLSAGIGGAAGGGSGTARRGLLQSPVRWFCEPQLMQNMVVCRPGFLRPGGWLLLRRLGFELVHLRLG